MKTIGHPFVLVSLAAMAMTAAMGAEPSANDIRRCASIADSTARLACFDQLSGSAAAASSKKAPVAPAAAASAAASPVAPAVPAAAALGAESLPKTRAEKAATSGPTSLTARITDVLATQGNMYRISLDNGQVWQTQEGRSVFLVRPGDEVRIDKRSMGSYQLGKVVDGKVGYPVRAVRQK